MPAACVFLFDGFADWEAASAMAELRRSFGYETKTMAITRQPVTSMGGLRVIPDMTLAEFDAADAAILILPGGDAWMAGERPEITALVRATASAGRPVAGICAATVALAHAGLLDDRAHTSNGADFLPRFAPRYRGAALYRAVPAVSDRGVITASGVAPIAFAAEIFRVLAPARASDIEMYEGLYRRGIL